MLYQLLNSKLVSTAYSLALTCRTTEMHVMITIMVQTYKTVPKYGT